MTATKPVQERDISTDPIFLEVFWTRVRSVVNEAAKLIVRTSFSTLSTEANDFAVVVTDTAGRELAENAGSIPSFIGTLPATVRDAISHFGSKVMSPGDVYIRSEEHTSELQSLMSNSYAVFCLKKQTQ